MLRRLAAGLVLLGAVLGLAAPLAQADVVPTAKDIQRDIADLKLQPPAVGVPTRGAACSGDRVEWTSPGSTIV